MSEQSSSIRSVSSENVVVEDSTGRVVLWFLLLVVLGGAFLYSLFWYIQPLFTGIYPQ